MNNGFLRCQMCGHEQSPVEARFSEIFDTCGICGARIIREPKPEDGLLEEVLLAKLAKRDALIEKLIETGDWAQGLLDDNNLRMDGEWHEAQMSQEKEWNALIDECKAQK